MQWMKIGAGVHCHRVEWSGEGERGKLMRRIEQATLESQLRVPLVEQALASKPQWSPQQLRSFRRISSSIAAQLLHKLKQGASGSP